MNKNNFYVTTPIYYVNDKPHIGHAYTTILADVLARGHRLLGDPTHFLTGTDEHGQKVQQAAEKLNITPIEQCDNTVKRFQELWKKLGITNDDFIRTTEPRHTKIVQEILQDLYDRDLIYSSEYEGWYCVPCERFFTEKDLVDQCCPDCHRPVEKLVEKNYFFKMSQFQQQLIDYIESHPKFILPLNRRQETLGFLRKPLNDLCISRPKSRLAWGIDLPFDHDYVTYVWFDALVNYISAVGYRSNDQEFKKWWPASYHLIGKDILTTHTVYWPTMLMAMGVELPETIFAHGWWLVSDAKMSKSVGNVVNPMDMAEDYGVDSLRYFLMAAMSLGQDANFSVDAFTTKYNADLANNLGNFVSRTIKMLENNFDGIMPPEAPEDEFSSNLRKACEDAVTGMSNGIKNMQLDRGIMTVNAALREGNKYFDQMKPWALAKSGDRITLGIILRNSAECLRIVSGLLYPVMPEKMLKLRQILGIPEKKLKPQMDLLNHWNVLLSGTHTGSIKTPLFMRIDRVKKQQQAPETKKVKKTPTPQPALQEVVPGVITFDDFMKVILKTAEIQTAEKVEGSDKLIRLELAVGTEKRQIVAGIGKSYTPNELLGKTIIIVANLKPRKLMGLESQGMLLAAKTDKELHLLITDGPIPSGIRVG